ncbi:helix-turn-helix domain-containing protein [Nocardia vaccinii]|uniref:helix-turn-helix domain-containing protein n=1 Tax=Nocardia vaccinii TaxID=1822 RepID=UPI0035A26124
MTGTPGSCGGGAGLTQQAVSKRIAKLEGQLGVSLFDRSSSGSVIGPAFRSGRDALLNGRVIRAPDLRADCGVPDRSRVLITPPDVITDRRVPHRMGAVITPTPRHDRHTSPALHAACFRGLPRHPLEDPSQRLPTDIGDPVAPQVVPSAHPEQLTLETSGQASVISHRPFFASSSVAQVAGAL